ncbi:YusW family protein [Carnobacterium divergens]|uniref:Uncharacterized protein n=1 Tax=Carnobacterium divergens TaxID=2748 RepID=A0A7Z8CZE4_CARDV|nr:YusW family protein [Carnobacterium divergens]TFI73880.1 hypothetical protein CKN58_04755 [Carnobacterium divergens]TFI77850.1 hypothetical protein CKN85_04750 [Carnobacterium divergens]TFI84691.1 hypothetical protein CKN56_04725 [Carnobacterium divergens]TFI96730.1 hypothetical protein CKN64_04725 [Carnobacterium divergens]TFJ12677.1 hypothetical protein CKN60_04795 [Carnobacterium divergens]
MRNKLWPAWILVLIIYGQQELSVFKEERAQPIEITSTTTNEASIESNDSSNYSEKLEDTTQKATLLAVQKMKIDYRSHHQKLKLRYQVQNNEVKAKIQQNHEKAKGIRAQNKIEDLFQSTDFSTATADSLLKTLQTAYQLPDYTNYQIDLTLQDGTQLEFENDD